MSSETRRIVTGDGKVHEVVIEYDKVSGCWIAQSDETRSTFPATTADAAMVAFVQGFCDVLDIREVVPPGGKTSDEKAIEAGSMGAVAAIDTMERRILADLEAVRLRAQEVRLPHNGTNPEWVRYRSAFTTLQTLLAFCGKCRGWEPDP